MPNSINPITDAAEIAKYQRDESNGFEGRADRLYIPESEAELCTIIKSLYTDKIFFTISGGGTGITGSRCPVYGGAVISTERIMRPQKSCPKSFKEISTLGYTIYLNSKDKTAIIPGSIPLNTLDSILSGHNLIYPPDPTEMSATLGGTAATNASGARSFYYGATRKWIRGLRIVLPAGEVLELERGEITAIGNSLVIPHKTGNISIPIPLYKDYPMPEVKNTAGLYLKTEMDAIDLFIGSEGILGCFTDITVQLIERISQTLTIVAYFDSESDALVFADSGVCKKSPLSFLSIEFFDRNSLDFMRKKYTDISLAESAILFELAYDKKDSGSIYPSVDFLKTVETELLKYQASDNWSIPYTSREDIRLFRHALPEAVNDYVRNLSGKIGTDMAVPHDKLPEMMRLNHEWSRETKVPYVIYGHIGNDHTHLNFLPDDPEAAERAREVYARLAAQAVKFGGTISAEHGVGKKKIRDTDGNLIPYLKIMYGEKGLEIIARIKKILDPLGLMNTGNMIPREMTGDFFMGEE